MKRYTMLKMMLKYEKQMSALDKMNKIPKNWEVAKLNSIIVKSFSGEWGVQYPASNSKECRVIRGTDIPRVKRKNTDLLPVRYISNVKYDAKKPESGDFLVEISGGSVDQPTGRILLVDKKLASSNLFFSNFVRLLRINTAQISPLYFYWHWENLYSRNKTALYENRTVNIRNFKLKEFLGANSVIIHPLPEQQKIAEILSTADEAIGKMDEAIAKAGRLKQGLLQKLLSEGIGHKEFKTNVVGKIPKSWDVVKIGEAFEILVGGDISKLNFSKEKNERYRYPVYSNSLEGNGLYGYSDTFGYLENCITVTARGTLGHAVPRFGKFNAIIRVLILRPKVKSDIVFVSEYINSRINFKLEKTSIPQLTAPNIAKYTIPSPPFAEQQKIAEILSAADEKIEILRRRREKLERVKKSLMNDLLTGKKRVRF